MRRALESGAGDEDYFHTALMDYQPETETTFKYRHYEVQEIRRPIGRDKARDAVKKKGSRGSRASGSSSTNDEAYARLMVRNQEYRQRQEDIRFYLQPYDHLTGDARLVMEELRAEIKANAMNNLYAALGYPPLPGWTASAGDPCAEGWQGVVCDATNTNVLSITVISANLGGELGDTLGSFSSLQSLDLSNNLIGGGLPSELPVTITT
ncbi:STRUBBELIG-receptor family 3-like protein isoform X1, partial [Tanacetum coccineum]